MIKARGRTSPRAPPTTACAQRSYRRLGFAPDEVTAERQRRADPRPAQQLVHPARAVPVRAAYRGKPPDNGPMEGRLLRWGLPRDPRAVPHLVAFVVSTVATVLITRGLLAASGYPQLGGRGLHVAHVLWGGLLLALAVFALLSFVGPVARPFAALLGGVGFGLFIDEVGKFVTSDTDYFYRPAVAIMYVTVVLLVLAVHWLHGRRPLRAAEYLAGAVDEAVAGVGRGLAPARRRTATDRLRRAGEIRGAAATEALLTELPEDTTELADPTGRVGRMVRTVGGRVFGSRLALRITLVLLLLETAGTLFSLAFVAVAAAVRSGEQLNSVSTFATGASTVGTVASAVCVIIGFAYRRRSRTAAYGWYQRAVLIDLLVTRVFAFALDEFAAVPALLLDLAMLAILGHARRTIR
jgi:hypothetical protein